MSSDEQVLVEVCSSGLGTAICFKGVDLEGYYLSLPPGFELFFPDNSELVISKSGIRLQILRRKKVTA